MTDPTQHPTRHWFRDFNDYAGWFVFWGTLVWLIRPGAPTQDPGAFWAAKAHQALFGVGFGLACALTFTILQNGFNRPRTKSISWIFAIGSWAVISMLVTLLTGAFG